MAFMENAEGNEGNLNISHYYTTYTTPFTDVKMNVTVLLVACYIKI